MGAGERLCAWFPTHQSEAEDRFWCGKCFFFKLASAFYGKIQECKPKQRPFQGFSSMFRWRSLSRSLQWSSFFATQMSHDDEDRVGSERRTSKPRPGKRKQARERDILGHLSKQSSQIILHSGKPNDTAGDKRKSKSEDERKTKSGWKFGLFYLMTTSYRAKILLLTRTPVEAAMIGLSCWPLLTKANCWKMKKKLVEEERRRECTTIYVSRESVVDHFIFSHPVNGRQVMAEASSSFSFSFVLVLFFLSHSLNLILAHYLQPLEYNKLFACEQLLISYFRSP